MDPPTADERPQEGVINVRDFSVRGEAALERVVAGAPTAPATASSFALRADSPARPASWRFATASSAAP